MDGMFNADSDGDEDLLWAESRPAPPLLQPRPHFIVRCDNRRVYLNAEDKTSYTMGRGTRCDIGIAGRDPLTGNEIISRLHAVVKVEGDKFLVTVISDNKMRLDDQLLNKNETGELHDGSKLHVGEVEVATFHLFDAENDEQPAATTSRDERNESVAVAAVILASMAANSSSSMEASNTQELTAPSSGPASRRRDRPSNVVRMMNVGGTPPEDDIIEILDDDDDEGDAHARSARLPRPIPIAATGDSGGGDGSSESPIVLGLDSPPPAFPVFRRTVIPPRMLHHRKRPHSDVSSSSSQQDMNMEPKTCDCACNCKTAKATLSMGDDVKPAVAPVAVEEPAAPPPPPPVIGVQLDAAILQCSICLDLCHKAASVHPCNHKFCYACILEWNARQGTCPQCRQKTVGVSRDKVFDQVIAAYLEAHPESRRDPEDLAELDAKEASLEAEAAPPVARGRTRRARHGPRAADEPHIRYMQFNVNPNPNPPQNHPNPYRQGDHVPYQHHPELMHHYLVHQMAQMRNRHPQPPAVAMGIMPLRPA